MQSEVCRRVATRESCVKGQNVSVTLPNQRTVRIGFLSAEDNLPSMLKLAKKRSLESGSAKKLTTSGLLTVITKEDKKARLESTEKYLQANLGCYKEVAQEEKGASFNPQIVFVFNSRRRVLEMEGFPMLMKEIAEIFESGNLLDFTCIDFVSSIQRYSSI